MREAPLPAAAAEAPSNDWRSGPIAGFVLAAVGGAIAWAILEWTPPPFTVPEEYHVLGIGAPSEKHAALEAVEV